MCFVILLSLGAVLSGGSLPELHFSSCFLPGVVSGMLWNAGNIASIYAVQPPLGFAVGYPVTQVRAAWFNRRRSVLTQRCRLSVCLCDNVVQCCTLIAGLLGIIVYGEIQGAKLIAAWVVSACVLLSGAAMLGYYGSSAN